MPRLIGYRAPADPVFLGAYTLIGRTFHPDGTMTRVAVWSPGITLVDLKIPPEDPPISAPDIPQATVHRLRGYR